MDNIVITQHNQPKSLVFSFTTLIFVFNSLEEQAMDAQSSISNLKNGGTVQIFDRRWIQHRAGAESSGLFLCT
jgi:hypothetical protein